MIKQKEKSFCMDVLNTHSSFIVNKLSKISSLWNNLTSSTAVHLLNALSKNNSNLNNQEIIHCDFLRKVQLFVSKTFIYVMNDSELARKCSLDYVIQF